MKEFFSKIIMFFLRLFKNGDQYSFVENIDHSLPIITVENDNSTLSRLSRRLRRHPARKIYRNDRTPVASGLHTSGYVWNSQAVYLPKWKKLKGWQKEAKRR
jgi:hypothetical protein